MANAFNGLVSAIADIGFWQASDSSAAVAVIWDACQIFSSIQKFVSELTTSATSGSNERIRSVGQSEVAFKVRADDQGGKRVVRLPGTGFVRRFMLHMLPTGIKRIRHYGVLASGCKGKKLNAARLALQMPAVNPQALESAQGFMARVARMDVGLCPCCKVGRLRTAAVLAGVKSLPSPASAVLPQERGPP